MAEYREKDWWDSRYAANLEPFDWYFRWVQIRELLSRHMQPTDRILNIGCGNSRLADEMHKDNFTCILNIDFSSVVIAQMQAKYPDQHFEELDVLQMPYHEKFDVVIDKGTLDSVLCGDNPSPNSFNMLCKVSESLKPGGTYIVISHTQPAQRLNYLAKDEFNWQVDVETLQRPVVAGEGESIVHFVYFCKKLTRAS
jgi:2-polyprenyl-3-methyl-5-hydroxy-6-metoxy-1,4-benzoquinol methylase